MRPGAVHIRADNFDVWLDNAQMQFLCQPRELTVRNTREWEAMISWGLHKSPGQPTSLYVIHRAGAGTEVVWFANAAVMDQ